MPSDRTAIEWSSGPGVKSDLTWPMAAFAAEAALDNPRGAGPQRPRTGPLDAQPSMSFTVSRSSTSSALVAAIFEAANSPCSKPSRTTS